MKPLSGLRIVVTRAAHQAEPLASPLRELGADVLLAPLIGIGPPSDPAPLRQAAAQCHQYDWIIFTSSNAVAAFAAELPSPPPPLRARVAAVGDSTRDAAEKAGLPVALVPREYVAEALAESFAQEPLANARILIPSAAVTRDVVPDALRRMGARVDVVEAYRNIIPEGARERLHEILREPFPDWITFASPSAIEHALQLTAPAIIGRMNIASIGPVTSRAIEKHGLAVAAEASPHTAPALVTAILRASQPKGPAA